MSRREGQDGAGTTQAATVSALAVCLAVVDSSHDIAEVPILGIMGLPASITLALQCRNTQRCLDYSLDVLSVERLSEL